MTTTFKHKMFTSRHLSRVSRVMHYARAGSLATITAVSLSICLTACEKSTPGRAEGKKGGPQAFEVPGEWQDAPGFDATPVGSDESYLVYQSKDFHDLLVVPPTGDEAWVLDLGDKRVAAIPRGRLSITSDGAQVSSATPVEKGVFTKNGADIFFQAGDHNIRVFPWVPLTGEMDLETLLAKKKDYAVSASEYQPDPWAVGTLKARHRPLEFVVFFGTWCSTCHRYVPELIRAFQDADNPALKVRYIAVDENLTMPRDLIDQFHVRMTPTVIVVDKGREIGRFVGLPKTTIEREVASVLAGH